MGLMDLCKRHSTAVALAAYVLFLLLAGLVPGSMAPGWLGYFAFCLLTGIVEEAIFCGVIFQLLAGWRSCLQPAVVTAALFGLAHLSFAYGVGLGLMKVLQAGLFGLCMVLLFANTRKLIWPMLAHASFDAAYFAAPFADTGALPPYPVAVAPDANFAVLAATALFFAIAAAIMFRLNKQKKG